VQSTAAAATLGCEYVGERNCRADHCSVPGRTVAKTKLEGSSMMCGGNKLGVNTTSLPLLTLHKHVNSFPATIEKWFCWWSRPL